MSDVLTPCAGRVIPLREVPDAVFAAEMVGPGLAVDPDRDATIVSAPVGGRLVKVHPHAFVITREDGIAFLVHLGIDTVKLAGDGFQVLQQEGVTVDAGVPVVRWDPAAIEAGGRSPVIPVCVLDAQAGSVTTDRDRAEVGETLFAWPPHD
ncbi:MAG TPA: PTS glucose transporter subunit IIA [Dermatophilaceae bacterium]|nr:PTS glucose transporter subunit IIA [Dermatophilaceae bacterium]